MSEQYNHVAQMWETTEQRWDDAGEKIVTTVTATRPATAQEIAHYDCERTSSEQSNASDPLSNGADWARQTLTNLSSAVDATQRLLKAYSSFDLEAGCLPGLAAQLETASERAISALETLETRRATYHAATERYTAALARKREVANDT